MARVEKNAALEERLADVKGEVVAEVRRRTRVSRPWLTCSLLILATLVALAVWITWMIAATGLVKIPVFTTLAYEAPAPYREVTPGVPAETVLEEAFTSTLTRRLYEGGGELTNRSIEILLNETSLTASLRTFLEQSDLEWIDRSHVQLVVDPEVGIEIFVPISSEFNELGTAGIVRFEVSVSEGNLVVTPKTVSIGNAKIPSMLIAIFLKPFLEAELAKLNANMVGYAQIFSLEILPRELWIVGELAVEIQESL